LPGRQVAFFAGVVNISFALPDALARFRSARGARSPSKPAISGVLRPRSTALQLAGHEFTRFASAVCCRA
jgi:hypothetical protein